MNSLDVSDAFLVLGNSRRREVIKVLEDVGGEACISEVVRRVAMKEADSPDRRLRKSVHVSLVQNHLPKLKLAGIVEYDRWGDTLRLLELPKEYRYLLEVVEKGDLPWCLYYLGLSIFGVLSGLLYSAYMGFQLHSLLLLLFSSLMFVSAFFHTARTYGVSGNEALTTGIKSITNSIKKQLKTSEKR